MRTLTQILVVVDTRKNESLALHRARLLAKATDTPVVALAPNPHGNAQSLQRLEDMIQPLKDDAIKITAIEQWHNSAVETIIHIRQLERCSLVIKEPKQNKNALKSIVFTPEDWSLLRQCRVPVLLARNRDSWMNGKVMAAVDACPLDSRHDVLNGVIMEYAAAIAGMSNSECHIVSAHPGAMLSGSAKPDDSEVRYQNGCNSLAKRFDIPSEHVHVGEGPAEILIPERAKDLGISLVVIGTVANASIKGALLGNTAEQILSMIHTDVLTLKPRDLMDPLENVVR